MYSANPEALALVLAFLVVIPEGDLLLPLLLPLPLLLLLPLFFVVILSGAKDPRIFPLPFPLLVFLLSFRSAAKESAFVSNPPQK
jgi:hypothetical protein